MYCTNSKDEFEFNLDNIGTTGEILINDFVTKRQYRLKLFEHEHLLWWVNILCSSQCYSHYRKNDQIYLVVPVNEHLKYICGKSSERSEDGKSPTEGGVTFGSCMTGAGSWSWSWSASTGNAPKLSMTPDMRI